MFSPAVSSRGQVDCRDLELLARDICARASAVTAREKAEAIRRFFLTDGRFVAPAFWYHIASALDITHQWIADGSLKQHVEQVANPRMPRSCAVETGNAVSFRPHALIFYCPPRRAPGR